MSTNIKYFPHKINKINHCFFSRAALNQPNDIEVRLPPEPGHSSFSAFLFLSLNKYIITIEIFSKNFILKKVR